MSALVTVADILSGSLFSFTVVSTHKAEIEMNL